jgi:TRAP-type C4-dicarboxylate transport system permease small subunit
VKLSDEFYFGEIMNQILRTLTKALLIFFGALMLLGGGVCVASNAYFTVASLLHPGVAILWFLVLMGISGGFALTGWKLLQLSGVTRQSKSEQKVTAEISNKPDSE